MQSLCSADGRTEEKVCVQMNWIWTRAASPVLHNTNVSCMWHEDNFIETTNNNITQSALSDYKHISGILLQTLFLTHTQTHINPFAYIGTWLCVNDNNPSKTKYSVVIVVVVKFVPSTRKEHKIFTFSLPHSYMYKYICTDCT